jgi:hypothetical protein
VGLSWTVADLAIAVAAQDGRKAAEKAVLAAVAMMCDRRMEGRSSAYWSVLRVRDEVDRRRSPENRRSHNAAT